MPALIFIGSRGQAFEPFNMLIGAIVALTILTIIISAITYFDQKRIEVSWEKLNDGYRNAVRQPNGSPLLVKDVLLEKGMRIAPRQVSLAMGIGTECVEVDTGGTAGLVQSNELIEVKERLLTSALVTCNTTSSNCEIECTVSFEGN